VFEEKTFENILKSMLEKVPSSFDKREGSIIYDALAPAAAELTQLYMDLDFTLKETFADTADRQYLIMRAAERGFTPYPATYAVVKGVFNVDVPIGSRFSIDIFNYAVTEVISSEEHSFKLVCETAGSEPNGYIGKLIPVEYIKGLTSAEITEILIPGEDEEDTEDFRKRYLNSFNSQAFGGNVADYKLKVNAITGVGGVKVYPIWNGGGTVKLVIINSEFNVPSSELIEEVQTAIDPVQNQGEGLGIAPIGHIVTVEGVSETTVDIVTEITYTEGWSWESIESLVNDVIDQYFNELNSNWADNTNIIVRISQLESRLLDLEGITDIGNTSFNGEQKNFTAGENSIVKRGSVNA
jgi:uncharacterized phage protein gp47/JayE